MLTPIKPIPIKIDTTRRNTANLPNPGGYAIEYACGKCKSLLSYWLGTEELCCHRCGHPIDWRVITYLNSVQSDKIADLSGELAEELKSNFIEMIKNLNETKFFDSTVYISEPESFGGGNNV